MNDTAELPGHIKYKESRENYTAKLYRTAVAVRKELEPGLKRVVDLSGAKSLSNMLTLLASSPEECAKLLEPVFARITSEKVGSRVTMKAVLEEIKSSDLTPEEIAAAIAAAKASKAVAGAAQ